MTTYCGVGFHARQQTICYCDTADGLIQCHELHHARNDVRAFYSQFTGDVVVGLEASGYSAWFVELLETLGHQVFIGDTTEIRRRARSRHKTDRRDAELLLDLLLRQEFPQVHRASFESREILRLLRHRHRLVQMRTKCKNSLQALAFSAGAARRATLFRHKGRASFLELPMSAAMTRQRSEWLAFVAQFDERIRELDGWLSEQARQGYCRSVPCGCSKN